ncbi:hypothetical protein AB0J21_29615 [Streptomyces sp. NPDC049954]|uniref:hypothetical protein n=1 Tax=Streptomyces sp. NPDC049954 TaxID=3155779 RepID=UPI003414FABA
MRSRAEARWRPTALAGTSDGFFREIGLNPASSPDSIHDALLEDPPEHRDALIRYLRGGIKIIVVAGGAPDVLMRGR